MDSGAAFFDSLGSFFHHCTQLFFLSLFFKHSKRFISIRFILLQLFQQQKKMHKTTIDLQDEHQPMQIEKDKNKTAE